MRSKYSDIKTLARIQIIIIPIFAFFKFLRPSVLSSECAMWIKTTFLSAPNFFQALTGVLVLAGLGLLVNDLTKKIIYIKEPYLYILATLIAAIYVITQEINFYNIRGNNTYDRNDVIFSLLGLILGYVIVCKIRPKIHINS